MFLFVFIVFFSHARAEDEIRLTCRREVHNLSWSFDPNCPERAPQLAEIKSHSTNYQEPGTCNVKGEKLSILRSQVGCPAISVEEVSRPVQIVAKIKAPCEAYELYGSDPEYATVEVFSFFGIRLDLQEHKVEYKLYGQAGWQIAYNVTMHGSIYGDQEGEDDFHELMFDMQVDASLLYYNGLLLKWAMDMGEFGKIQLTGGADYLLMNWIMIRDTTCSMECDSRWDCNGHGVTTDIDGSDGCDCVCDFNWFGDDCRKQTFIPLTEDKTCDQPPSVRTSGATFLSCINFCAAQNYTCNYFAFNDLRATCETFTECFIDGIDVLGSTVYQKREMCKLDQDVLGGNMYIGMLDSSGFTADGEYLLYVQYPSEGITLNVLEFEDTSHGCTAWNHNCRGFPEGWEEMSLGCMTIMKGTFPRMFYQPDQGWNDFGFDIDGEILSSYLRAEFSQPVIFMGEETVREITLTMPWMIVMDTVLVLEISLGTEAVCHPTCEGCSTCDAGECIPTTGDPCDDGLVSTWPDYCNNGVCMGTALTCRHLTQGMDWVLDCPPGVQGFVGDTHVQTYSAGYSISAQGIGLCLEQEEIEYVIRDCPAESVETFTRPAKLTFKTKSPCAMWEQGVLIAARFEFKDSILKSYGVMINGAGQIFVMLHGQEYIPVQSLKVDGTAFDDETGDDSFHEIVIDMRSREVTYFYYNGRQIGESMTYIESGTIQVEGVWHTQVRVDDTSCPSACDALYDCSGHGTTTDTNMYDGCLCVCDENWTGNDCSQEIFIDLGEGSTCGGDPIEVSSQGSFEDCVEFCDENDCIYFTFDEDTEECSLYEECIIENSEEGTVPYQNRDICYLDPAVIGSMEIKLLLSSTFANDTLILYFQYPSAGMTLDELHFLGPTDDRGHYRRWGNENSYWTAETVGCMTIMEGRFPFTDFFSPPMVNSLGLIVASNTLAGTLFSKCSQDMIFFERVVQRRLEYQSVFVLVLQTTLELSIEVGTKDVCEGAGCGQCQECGEGGICQPAREGEECDDFMQSTYPDTCVDGHCMGSDMCLTTVCEECQRCIVVLNCDEDGHPCSECHADPNKENTSCADDSRICASGSCVQPTPPECSSFDHCNYFCDSVGCGSQEGLVNPCCPIGYCPQPHSTFPSCCGGHCDQTNSTDCSCDGGFCEQRGCSNPSCNGGGCSGNCDLMAPQTCHICVDGMLLPNNIATCFLAGFENSQCIDGLCVGEDIRCASNPPCPPCHSCVAEGADAICELDPALEGTICLPPDVRCQDGMCIPPFQLVDSLVVNFGLQESDLSNLQAVISINGMTSARWPWKLIEHENFMVISTREFPVKSNEPFVITKDCSRPRGEENCLQDWAVTFTVDKICDTISKYDLLFFGDNWENDDVGSSIWTISVSQVSVCGMIIQDAPLEGTIRFMNEMYNRESTMSSFSLGSTVYVQLETSGVAPIVAVEVLYLSISHSGETYVMVGPGMDEDLRRTLQVDPENVNDDQVRWRLFLHRPHFVDSVLTPVTQRVTVRVTYRQGRRHLIRRYLIQKEEPAFEFSDDVLIRDKECSAPHTFTPVSVGNVFNVECISPGGKTVFLQCTDHGWEDLNKACADPVMFTTPAADNNSSSSMVLMAIIIIFVMIILAALIYKYVMDDDDCLDSASRDMKGNIRHKPRGVVKGRRNSSNGKRNSRRESKRRNSNRNSRRTSRADRESMRASRRQSSRNSQAYSLYE